MSDRDHQPVKKDLKIDSDRTSKVGDGDAYAAAGAFHRSDGAGVYAGAGLGRDEWDGGEGKGPNVGAGAELSLARGARAVVNADLVRVSQSVGPVKATLGLSAETGGTIGPGQVEAKVLGTDRDHQLVKKDLKIDSDRTSKVGDGDAYAAAGAFHRSDGAGVYAGAGLGRDEWDGGEGKGPNVGAGAELSLAGGARAVVNADLVRVSQSVGPGKVTLGLSAETGGTISPTQVEAKVLGTGFSFGRKMGFSILGNGFEFKLW